MPKSISVCIANYNGLDFIDACIQSVLLQKVDAPFEIIIHDDASTDASVTHIQQHYPNVKLIISANNVGFCIANNRMAEAASGDYLLLLNNDASLLPDALAALLKAAEDDNQAAIFGLPQYDAETGELLDSGLALDPFLNPVPLKALQRTEVGMISGACLWVPMSLWKSLGGFPAWFDTVGEDLYLCCRARLAGYPVIALGCSGFQHWVGKTLGGSKANQTTLTSNIRRRSLSERNKTFVMAICFPAPLFQVILPIHLTLIMLEGVVLSLLKHRSDIFWQIYLNVPLSLWKYRGYITAYRNVAQSSRRIGLFEFFKVFTWMPHKLRMLGHYGVPVFHVGSK